MVTRFQVVLVGLIPARAGNMGGSMLATGLMGAHPRSRGEHKGLTVAPAAAPGSSPLARGTWERVLRKPPVVGLIPARAGNITQFTPPNSPLRAHPRSRGEHTHRTPGMGL